MTSVLLIGVAPTALAASDLPPGVTQEDIAEGIKTALADMAARGWRGEFCSILPDDSAEATVAASLSSKWDCIVIGGGIRVPESSVKLFEKVINTVRRMAPGTNIAFNTNPEDTADAAARWVGS